MSITSTQGVIVLDGTVDGVDFAALRDDVIAHDHAVGGSVDSITETLSITGNPNFVTATDDAGANQATEKAVMSAGTSRSHGHGVGTFATDALTQGAAVAPSGTETTLTGTNGNIECRTVDGYAPEDIWSRYKDHYHDMDVSTTAYTMLGPHYIRGAGGANREWFRVRSGGSIYWAKVRTSAGQHRHAEGSCQYRALAAGAAPTAAGSEAKLDGINGRVITDGNVNGVDISAFKTAYDAHTHNGSANTAHRTATSPDAADQSRIHDDAGAAIEFDDGAGGWHIAYMSASWTNPGGSVVGGSQHTHACSGLSSGAPI